MELFSQDGPRLPDPWTSDHRLQSMTRRRLAPAFQADATARLEALAGITGGAMFELQQADRLNEPRLVRWDAWGRRIDTVEVSPLWQQAERIAAEHGLVATGYEKGAMGGHERFLQFALAYLFHPSSDVYTCPLAMTDGAARSLLDAGNPKLADRAVPRLTARDPERFWTSGQWMTEATGGSDVGRSLTEARRGEDGRWRLYGRKWFTSAVTADMALTLARPQGNGPGGKGLAMFYLELRDETGALNNLRVERLKDKLGTRKVPTAELILDGTLAEPVAGLDNGVRNISPMLTITRTWNSVCAVAGMQRGLSLAADYARRRIAFGRPLAEQPLHRATLAAQQAELEAGFQLTFELVDWLDRSEGGSLDTGQAAGLRLLTALVKLTTGKQGVAVASEVLEAFGGAGYVEDTGLPLLLRDAQVLPIWEGTTNVLSLEVLKAASAAGALSSIEQRLQQARSRLSDPALADAAGRAAQVASKAVNWLTTARPETVEAAARHFALTLGRSLALALACEHGQWSLDHLGDRRSLACALVFSRSCIDVLGTFPGDEAGACFGDNPGSPDALRA
jgi:alkylation response protein AidB-like acyl-CoA dehydrogenase